MFKIDPFDGLSYGVCREATAPRCSDSPTSMVLPPDRQDQVSSLLHSLSLNKNTSMFQQGMSTHKCVINMFRSCIAIMTNYVPFHYNSLYKVCISCFLKKDQISITFIIMIF